MRPALVGVDVVHEREDVLVVAIVVLERELDVDAVSLGIDVHDLLVQNLFLVVEELHHLPEAALGVEDLTLLHSLALVLERDADALVQIGQLAQPVGDGVVIELELGEDRVIGLEPDRRAARLGVDFVEHLELRHGVAALEVHVVLLPAAPHPHLQLLGERVHDRHADAVQSARHLVGVLVEFATRVQHRHRELDAGNFFGGMDVDRNSAAVIDDGDRIVGVDRHVDHRRMARQRFVDRVVDYFVNQVVETSRGRRADVHAGTFANCLETFENLYLTSVVLRRADFCCCFSHYSRDMFCVGPTQAHRRRRSTSFSGLSAAQNFAEIGTIPEASI